MFDLIFVEFSHYNVYQLIVIFGPRKYVGRLRYAGKNVLDASVWTWSLPQNGVSVL